MKLGLAYLRLGKIDSWSPAKAGTTWRKMKKNSIFGSDEGGSARTE
jgi:hypothetical protein